MQIFSSYVSEKGKGSKVNQDSLCITQFITHRKRVTMAMVCDGIGSFPNSEDASSFVTEWMVNWIYRDGLRAIRKYKEIGFVRAVKREFFRCHRKFSEITPTSNGTTISMLITINKRFFVFWSGDCRVYTLKSGRTKLLTDDDSESGVLNACFTNIGYHVPHHKTGRIKRHSGFLLCSDGFYRRLDPDLIKALLNSNSSKNPTEFKTRQLKECVGRNLSRNEVDDMSAVLINTN